MLEALEHSRVAAGGARGALRLYTYRELAADWALSVRTIQTWVSADTRAGIPVPRVRRRIARGRWVVFVTAETADALLRRHQPRLFA